MGVVNAQERIRLIKRETKRRVLAAPSLRAVGRVCYGQS